MMIGVSMVIVFLMCYGNEHSKFSNEWMMRGTLASDLHLGCLCLKRSFALSEGLFMYQITSCCILHSKADRHH